MVVEDLQPAGDVSFWSSTCFPFHLSKTVRFALSIEDVNVTVRWLRDKSRGAFRSGASQKTDYYCWSVKHALAKLDIN